MVDTPRTAKHALERVISADGPIERSQALIDALEGLMTTPAGVERVYQCVPELVTRRFFAGTVWENPARLLPPLVKTSLLAGGAGGTIEAISELRMLALSEGRLTDPRVSTAEARTFLDEAVVLNLDLVQLGASEEHRLAGGEALRRARCIVGFIVDRSSGPRLERVLLREIEQICRQRRILGAAAVDMIRRAERYADRSGSRTRRALARYVDAIEGVTALAQQHRDHAAYADALTELPSADLGAEARAFGRSLRLTGLASPQHATLIRSLAASKNRPALALALGLDRVGRAELARHESLVVRLIDVAVTPATPLAIAGLAGVLGRAALSMPGVSPGLRNLLRRQPSELATQRLLASRPFVDERSWPQALLVAGALAVVGQPLGVGQGDNPSCQSARAISLWSQVAPGYLLELLTSAAFDDCTRIRFRGVEIRSSDVPETDLGTDLRLDPASVVLVPHLHRTYQAMLALVHDEPGDAHRYVNPGLYGPWVPTGFECIFDQPQRPLPHADFIRGFLSVHHPDVALVEPIHPRPLGLVVTSAHGQYLGLHAISLQRVARDPLGRWRAYFFNPNDDGRQDWGQGIETSTSGFGEAPGESSLPLGAFASRIYAFHLHEHEVGSVGKDVDPLVDEAAKLASESWGRAFAARQSA